MAEQNLTRLLGRLIPTGLLGLSVALAPSPTEAATLARPLAETAERPVADVAARLSAIRAAVAEVTPEAPAASAPGKDSSLQNVWFGNHGWGRPWRWGGGWGNGGFGRPGWGNGGWGNGGWSNGGWGNGGWGNWHPWANF